MNNPGYKDAHVLMVTARLFQDIVGFARPEAGMPSGSAKSYWRMFYLSAVTITTLGYGDIVPISNVSRLLVASQAIIGVVLIGLFLNALTLKENKSKNGLSTTQGKEEVLCDQGDSTIVAEPDGSVDQGHSGLMEK
jgi:hypothetical protein